MGDCYGRNSDSVEAWGVVEALPLGSHGKEVSGTSRTAGSDAELAALVLILENVSAVTPALSSGCYEGRKAAGQPPSALQVRALSGGLVQGAVMGHSRESGPGCPDRCPTGAPGALGVGPAPSSAVPLRDESQRHLPTGLPPQPTADGS